MEYDMCMYQVGYYVGGMTTEVVGWCQKAQREKRSRNLLLIRKGRA